MELGWLIFVLFKYVCYIRDIGNGVLVEIERDEKIEFYRSVSLVSKIELFLGIWVDINVEGKVVDVFRFGELYVWFLVVYSICGDNINYKVGKDFFVFRGGNSGSGSRWCGSWGGIIVKVNGNCFVYRDGKVKGVNLGIEIVRVERYSNGGGNV